MKYNSIPIKFYFNKILTYDTISAEYAILKTETLFLFFLILLFTANTRKYRIHTHAHICKHVSLCTYACGYIRSD
jgi:hypothetical protein